MSYNIGQFRKDMRSSSDYLTSINASLSEITVQSNDFLAAYNFKDCAITLLSEVFTYGKNYYIRLGIARPEDYDQKITFSLKSQLNSQIIDSVVIPKKELADSINNTVIVELVFSPNAPYDQLILSLQRISYDYTIQDPQDGSYGRKIAIALDGNNREILKVTQINNVLPFIGRNELNKIGIQGPPGLLMCINGQGIRIGPNGIYEIKNNYIITFIGFVVENSNSSNNRDYFILDYQY